MKAGNPPVSESATLSLAKARATQSMRERSETEFWLAVRTHADDVPIVAALSLMFAMLGGKALTADEKNRIAKAADPHPRLARKTAAIAAATTEADVAAITWES